MSYILDALRKADAQRGASRAPGLHAHHLSADEAEQPGSWARSRLLWAVLAAGVLLIGLAAWQLSDEPEAMPDAAPMAAVPPAAAEPLPPPALSSPTPAPSPAPAPIAATAISPPAPEPRALPQPSADGPAAGEAPGGSRRNRIARTPVAPAQAQAPEPVSDTVPAGAPKLAISGGVYSSDAAQRMLIVNGQVFNEGGEPAPGVRLEQIRPSRAVLSYQGQRYTVAY